MLVVFFISFVIVLTPVSALSNSINPIKEEFISQFLNPVYLRFNAPSPIISNTGGFYF